LRKSFEIFPPGRTLRRRVAFSLAVVRLVLVPVIFLSIYYLFTMAWIVDRIVNVDAPIVNLAGQVADQMRDARRAERSYFLLRDSQYLQANREALAQLKATLDTIRDLAPSEKSSSQQALESVSLYEQQFSTAVSIAENPGGTAVERMQEVVRAYEKDLNDLLKQAGRRSRARLVDDLRSQVASFDVQIASTVEA